jgi:molybdopterin molybdotransferase
MTGSLGTVNGLLTLVLAQLRAVPPTHVPTRKALGMRLADDLVAPVAVPPRAIALRSGFAVASLDIAGASMHAPALLAREPSHVAAGESLPAGCDAVIDHDAVTRSGAVWEVAESTEPGRHARLEGHDLRQGALIARAGTHVTPEIVLAADLAGIEALSVVRPNVALQGFAEPETDWLMARLQGLGIGVIGKGSSDLIIRAAGDHPPRLALRPGDTAWISQADGLMVIEMPNRFDGIVGAWCALALPVLGKLLGSAIDGLPCELTRKVTSTVGFTEVALFRRNGATASPLAVGDLPLSAVALADTFRIVPPELEGYPQGTHVELTPIDNPFPATQR